MRRRTISATQAVFATAFWIASFGNLPLWRRLADLGLLERPADVLFAACLGIAIFGVLTLLLALLAWRGSLQPAATLLLIVSAVAGHFMLSYGVVIDPGMMTNALQTDAHEAAGLASWRLAAALALMAGLPIAAVLWKRPIAFAAAGRQAGRNLMLAALGFALAVAALAASFGTLVPVMRNHKELRYLVNPLAAIYSFGRAASRQWRRDESVLVRVGEDAHLRRVAHVRPPLLLLLVLGETGRSGNFSLNGYSRPTTPELEREPALVSFRNAWSCGTSTAASVPCMFSARGRDGYESGRQPQEGLLDVLLRAGLAVLWIDNQSGCKGVCDRVPSVSTSANAGSPWCAGGECLDGAMLEGLDARIDALDPQRVARGVVIVMHQMGSHGPAYHLRSPPDVKRFLPECTSAALDHCSRDEVVNAYDNSIVYTDRFLAQAVAWLKRRADRNDTAMIYVADHGESLGENNLYLHGMPYAIAPDVQKHVPWLTWLSDGFQRSSGLSPGCLHSMQQRRITHDGYFHSVLGIVDVETAAYRKELDVYADCRDQRASLASATP